jgi:hypothetical protein
MHFVAVPLLNGDTADVNIEQITHMRPHTTNKTNTEINFSGGQTLIIAESGRQALAEALSKIGR